MPSASTASRSPPTGETLDEETALRSDRHDDGVLHHLRLDQAQHFGAEILAAIRPAQATARDRSEAQMHAFDARRKHEDFAIRTRLRQIGHPRRIELEADVFAMFAARRLEEARAQRGLDHAEPAAQDAVFVEAGDAIEQDFQHVDDRLGLRVARFAARVDERCRRAADSLSRRRRASAFRSACAGASSRPLRPCGRRLRGADRAALRTARPADPRSADNG